MPEVIFAGPEGRLEGRYHPMPEKDAPILAAAVAGDADLLVTGDRTHFGKLYGKTLRGCEVATPAATLARLL